ncbi:MAG: hypothetical protein K8T90_04180 [Planctomycetes bacterium]|nr:hypothetical protein [Planctomycetota bacterium]
MTDAARPAVPAPRRSAWRVVVVTALVLMASIAAWIACGGSEPPPFPERVWTRWASSGDDTTFYTAPDGEVVPGWRLDMSLSGTGTSGSALEQIGPVVRQLRRFREAVRPLPPPTTINGVTYYPIRGGLFNRVERMHNVERFTKWRHGIHWVQWVAPSVIPVDEFRATPALVGTWRFESFGEVSAPDVRDVHFGPDGRILDRPDSLLIFGTWSEARGFVRRVRASQPWTNTIYVLSPDGNALLSTVGGREVARRVVDEK